MKTGKLIIRKTQRLKTEEGKRKIFVNYKKTTNKMVKKFSQKKVKVHAYFYYYSKF